MTKTEAIILCNKIERDPRSDDGYDAHGLDRRGRGWVVCVLDTQATAQNPSGRALEIANWDEWERALGAR